MEWMSGRFDIKEETLVELRSLGFSWKNISRDRNVCYSSHAGLFTAGCQILALPTCPLFSDITDEQLDSKVSAFLNEHGCLVGTSNGFGPFEI